MLPLAMLSQLVFKVRAEMKLTRLSRNVAAALKRIAGEVHRGRDTVFDPLALGD